MTERITVNAMRRAMTNTPSTAHNGDRKSAAKKARCMNGSVSMVMVVMMMVMMIGRDVNAIRLLE